MKIRTLEARWVLLWIIAIIMVGILVVAPAVLLPANIRKNSELNIIAQEVAIIEQANEQQLVRIMGYKQVNAALDRVELIPFKNPVEFFVQLNSIFKKNGVERSNVIPTATLRDGNFAASVTGTGEYYAVLDLIAAIRQDPHPMVIKDITINARDGQNIQNSVSVTMTLETIISSEDIETTTDKKTAAVSEDAQSADGKKESAASVVFGSGSLEGVE